MSARIPHFAGMAAAVGVAWTLALPLVASCSSSQQETTVPPVDTTNFAEALARLRAAGLRAEVDFFETPQPFGVGLGGIPVRDQDPEPGSRVARGSVVELTTGRSPVPSPAVRKDRPRFAVVPDLVGLSEPRAEERLGDAFWPRLERVDPLPAEKSERGLEAFVVASQRPAPGTRLPYTGRLTADGFRMSVVRITLRVP